MKQTAKQSVLKLLTGTCVWFTLLAVGLMLIRVLSEGDFDGIIGIPRFLLLLPCGLFLSAAGLVMRHTSLPGWSRLLLHYFLTVLAFFLFLWLPGGTTSGVRNLLAFAFATLLYAVGYGIVMLTRHRFHSFREEE